jgi:hypothetical protein
VLRVGAWRARAASVPAVFYPASVRPFVCHEPESYGWSSAAALRLGFALFSPQVKVDYVIDDVPRRQCVGAWATVATVSEPSQGCLWDAQVSGCLSRAETCCR